MRGPILVAYSWSPGGRMALAWALREAAFRHQPVRVIHVVEPDDRVHVDSTVARRRLASVMAEATNLGRVNIRASADVLEGTLADRLIGESSGADLLVLGAGAARRFEDPAWAPIWARVACPITIARGRMRIPDRRPVLVAVGERPHAYDEAVHEADLRDVGLFALMGGSTGAAEPRMGHAQLVVADMPQVPLDSSLRWVVDHTSECPLLLVPSLETV
jgi:nucleotide-binding universal stress UspA family protein